jgi:hypothetical protein
VELISSGQSPQRSEFIDASADGSSAFFTTQASLVPQDPGLTDIYVARIGGGFPFFPPPPPCEGEACQPPGPSPNDSPPASATFVGPQNPKGKPKCPKGKHRVKKNGKTKCVKNSKKQKKAKSKKQKKKAKAKNGRASR